MLYCIELNCIVCVVLHCTVLWEMGLERRNEMRWAPPYYIWHVMLHCVLYRTIGSREEEEVAVIEQMRWSTVGRRATSTYSESQYLWLLLLCDGTEYLHATAQCCVLYYTVLYCTVMYCTTLCDDVLPQLDLTRHLQLILFLYVSRLSTQQIRADQIGSDRKPR